MNSAPTVSVVTPSYNQGEFIQDTLESVMHQSEDVQHIVIDGGSTDDTISILESYENKYDLQWVSEPDRGQAHAVNKGFKQADGDFIGWLNSDDIYASRFAVERVLDTFSHHPEIDVVYGDQLIINDENVVKRVTQAPKWNPDRLIRGWSIPQPTAFLRRSVIDQYSLDESQEFSLDYEFWRRIATDHKFGRVPTIIAGDRLYGDTKRETNPEQHRRDSWELISSTIEPDIRYNILRSWDKLALGAHRVSGLKYIPGLSSWVNKESPVNLQVPPVRRLLLNQLAPRSMIDKFLFRY